MGKQLLVKGKKNMPIGLVGCVLSYQRWNQNLEKEGSYCAIFQSKTVLDKCLEVVYLGCNPHEEGIFSKGDFLPKRFYDDNPGYYSESRKEWKVWNSVGAFEWTDYKEHGILTINDFIVKKYV